MVDSFVTSLLDQVLGNVGRCLLCGAPAKADLCMPCEEDLPNIGRPCRRCALPLPGSGSECGHCLRDPPPFERSIVPFEYRWPVDALLNGFKSGGNLAFGQLLTQRLARAVKSAYAPCERPDCLIVTPIRVERLRQRGFNQALQMARVLGRQLNLPVRTGLLTCERKVVPQKSLRAQARRTNLRGAFRIGAPCSGHVALVDDVMTTGATARELSALLLQAGAHRVDIWCLARTPEPRFR